MNLYSSTSTPQKEGVDLVYIFRLNENFILVEFGGDKVQSVSLLSQSELSDTTCECHYFDLGTSYNLLPKLSNELVDENALKDFMNWPQNLKVYHVLDEVKNIEVQFQTSPVVDYAISHAIPAIHKHHIIEMILAVSKTDGAFTLIYDNTLVVSIVLNNELILCNLFTVKTDEEIIYYLLLLFQELNLSQEVFEVHFYGSFLEAPNNTKQYLSSYFRKFDILTFEKVEYKYQGIVRLSLDYHENY